jgi:hypothetical protein
MLDTAGLEKLFNEIGSIHRTFCAKRKVADAQWLEKKLPFSFTNSETAEFFQFSKYVRCLPVNTSQLVLKKII